jgi:hypothetical protein
MAFYWKQVALPVSYLRLDYYELGYAWVEKLVSDNSPTTWEPISVIQRSKVAYIVKDGNHRTMAAQRLRLKKVLCELLVIEE